MYAGFLALHLLFSQVPVVLLPCVQSDSTAVCHCKLALGFQVGDAPRCQKCGWFIGMLEWRPPFRSEGLPGMHGFQPVEVVKMNARAKRLGIPRYLSVLVTYGRAALDEALSRLRRSKPLACDECRNPGLDGIYGFRIQPGTWDGLDAFRPRGLQSDVVVSERFADLVRRHGFTNIKLVPTEQFV